MTVRFGSQEEKVAQIFHKFVYSRYIKIWDIVRSREQQENENRVRVLVEKLEQAEYREFLLKDEFEKEKFEFDKARN